MSDTQTTKYTVRETKQQFQFGLGAEAEPDFREKSLVSADTDCYLQNNTLQSDAIREFPSGQKLLQAFEEKPITIHDLERMEDNEARSSSFHTEAALRERNAIAFLEDYYTLLKDPLAGGITAARWDDFLRNVRK